MKNSDLSNETSEEPLINLNYPMNLKITHNDPMKTLEEPITNP